MKPGPWFALRATDTTGPTSQGTIQNVPFMESQDDTLASSVGGAVNVYPDSRRGRDRRTESDSRRLAYILVLLTFKLCLGSCEP